MKNKDSKLIIISALILTIIIIGGFFLLFNKDEHQDAEIVKIEYSFGGGFGTIKEVSKKYITFTNDGKVVLSNDYNDYTETIEIGKEKYNELSSFVKSRLSLFDEKPKEENSIMDGGSYYLTVELKDGTIKRIGGYMITNKKFEEIEDKISEFVNSERISQYRRNIKE